MKSIKLRVLFFILLLGINLYATNLSKIKIEYLNFDDISLQNFLGFLTKEYNINFNIQPNYSDLVVSIHIQNTTLQEVLNTIAFQNKLMYKQNGNSVYITAYKENIRKKFLRGELYKGKVKLKYASMSDVVNFLKDMMPGQTIVRSTTENKPYSNLFDANPELKRPKLSDADTDIDIFPKIKKESVNSTQNSKNKKNSFDATDENLTPKDTLYIVPFFNNNRIYFSSTSKELIREAKSLVSDIDVPLKQVLIQGQIFEVSLTDGFNSIFDFSSRSSKLVPLSANAASSVGFGNIAYSFLDSKLQATIDIAKIDGRATFVSSPMLLTMNRVKAKLDLTEDVSILTDVKEGKTTTSDGVTIVQQPTPVYEKKSIGTKLEITPYINSENEILLKIDIGVSSVSGRTQTIKVPLSNGSTEEYSVDSISTSQVQTVLSAANKRSIIFGGIIRETIANQVKKTPILGDIPILGIPFKKIEKSNEKKELVIILTPTIIDLKNPRRNLITKQVKTKANEIRNMEKDFYKHDKDRELDNKSLLENNLRDFRKALKKDLNLKNRRFKVKKKSKTKVNIQQSSSNYDKEIMEYLNE